MMSGLTELQQLAIAWKRKARARPSGRYIGHHFVAARFCARCGCNVSRWHEHWTDDRKKGDAGVAGGQQT